MVTQANTKNLTNVEPPRLKVVTVLPSVGSAEIGEMYLLVNDDSADTLKIHVRVIGGWIKTSALS